MASITNDPGGRRRLEFVSPHDGIRRPIRLGRMPVKAAEAIKGHVEHIIAARIAGQAIDARTSQWLAGLPPKLYDQLAGHGLVPKREAKAADTLGPFLADYLASRADLKAGTREQLDYARRNLVEFFGSDKPLAEITEGDADAYRLHLVGAGLSENTIRRRIGRARQFFTAAQRRRLIAQNPWVGLAATVRANVDRFYFVTRSEAQRVIDACPNAEWRLLVALSRYGGLRCPSEHLSLRWGDIDWAGGKITVRSPKTEHHAGGGTRLVPLFAELLPYLDAAWEHAEPGAEYVITRYRSPQVNLRTQLGRIIRRAGLQPWPKLWQNMRSTRETELAETYPLHVVCAWIGNSQPVAARHYLQVTDEHFRRASATPTGPAGPGPKSDAKSDAVHDRRRP